MKIENLARDRSVSAVALYDVVLHSIVYLLADMNDTSDLAEDGFGFFISIGNISRLA